MYIRTRILSRSTIWSAVSSNPAVLDPDHCYPSIDTKVVYNCTCTVHSYMWIIYNSLCIMRNSIYKTLSQLNSQINQISVQIFPKPPINPPRTPQPKLTGIESACTLKKRNHPSAEKRAQCPHARATRSVRTRTHIYTRTHRENPMGGARALETQEPSWRAVEKGDILGWLCAHFISSRAARSTHSPLRLESDSRPSPARRLARLALAECITRGWTTPLAKHTSRSHRGDTIYDAMCIIGRRAENSPAAAARSRETEIRDLRGEREREIFR